MKQPRLDQSFRHALEGIVTTFKEERNFRLHLGGAILVVALGLFTRLSTTEWMACLICIVLVLATELINTALERMSDAITTKECQFIKKAKDASAGACLLIALLSAIIGLLIFGPKLISFLCVNR